MVENVLLRCALRDQPPSLRQVVAEPRTGVRGRALLDMSGGWQTQGAETTQCGRGKATTSSWSTWSATAHATARADGEEDDDLDDGHGPSLRQIRAPTCSRRESTWSDRRWGQSWGSGGWGQDGRQQDSTWRWGSWSQSKGAKQRGLQRSTLLGWLNQLPLMVEVTVEVGLKH